MRKVLISVAAAGTALAFAAPAAAQYFPAQYQQPGYGYGYNNRGQVRALQMRIDSIQRQIENLRARRMISRDEANGLRSEASNIERRLYRASRYGLDRREMRDVEYRIGRLEQHVRHEVRDGRRWGDNGYNGYNGYQNAGYDRDRDGRDDRWEDDHGRDHDND